MRSGEVALPRALEREPVVFERGDIWIASAQRVTRIAGWPDLTAWSRARSRGQWRAHRPRSDFRALVDLERAVGSVDDLPQKVQAWVSLLAPIPDAVKDAVCRFEQGHWQLLRLLGRAPQAIDLFNNPALAFLLAHIERFADRTVTLVDVLHLASGRRRDLCRAAGFPGQEATVRLLARLPYAALDVLYLRRLRSLVVESPRWARELAHLSRLNPAVLSMATRERMRFVATRSLLRQLVTMDDAGRAVSSIEDTLEMAAAVDELGGRGSALLPQAGLRDMQHVKRIHDDLIAELNHTEALSLPASIASRGPLPAPPVPGCADVVPLTTVQELMAESRGQKSCVGSYARRVRAGATYVYRLLRPQRATLSLVRERGEWKIADLKTAGNGAADPETWRVARAWLDEARLEGPGRRTTPAGAPVDTRPPPVGAPPSVRFARPAPSRAEGPRRYYDLLAPQHARLVVLQSGGRWTIEDLSSKTPRPIEQRTVDAVRRWLAHSRATDLACRPWPGTAPGTSP